MDVKGVPSSAVEKKMGSGVNERVGALILVMGMGGSGRSRI